MAGAGEDNCADPEVGRVPQMTSAEPEHVGPGDRNEGGQEMRPVEQRMKNAGADAADVRACRMRPHAVGQAALGEFRADGRDDRQRGALPALEDPERQMGRQQNRVISSGGRNRLSTRTSRCRGAATFRRGRAPLSTAIGSALPDFMELVDRRMLDRLRRARGPANHDPIHGRGEPRP